MVLSYLFAQTLCLVRKRPGGGSLLVLGSANVDETLRGYYTKYAISFLQLWTFSLINFFLVKIRLQFRRSQSDRYLTPPECPMTYLKLRSNTRTKTGAISKVDLKKFIGWAETVSLLPPAPHLPVPVPPPPNFPNRTSTSPSSTPS